ncbi:MAG TPA: hypothetical protein ENJ15_00555 [Caldithrix abyssi]|uniref:Uncharacterized protein n=1 Tax=Caldithrix abyssi TaxID=187145 RepID=A0A7V5RMU0_CALAY|nr:hypothetical protein [Caldithrix abyssi]
MRNKYLYFKLLDLQQPVEEVRRFSEMEISALLGPVLPIDNIFQLSQQPEIKRIIEKDLPLQNALTDGLPGRGRHGYLWSGDAPPNVIPLLKRLAYIKEIFLFQQALEPDPQWLREELSNMPYREYNVYLWRVFRISTRSFLWDRLLYIEQTSRNENEADTQIKNLKEELLLSPEAENDLNPYEMISYARPPRPASFFFDLKKRSQRLPDRRWIQASLNALAPHPESSLQALFDTEEEIYTRAICLGLDVTTVELNPIKAAIQQANAALPHIRLSELSSLINELQSKINMLMSATAAAQTDLFMYSAEGQFISYWQDERRRLKTHGFSLPEPFLKYAACTRFLIETGALSKDSGLNTIVLAALIMTLQGALRKKELPSFVSSLIDYLRRFYLKRYLLGKFDAWLPMTYGRLNCFNDDVFKTTEVRDSTILFLPNRLGKSGFSREDRNIIEMLKLLPVVQKAERQLLGHRDIPDALLEEYREEMSEKGGLARWLPRQMDEFFTRLELMSRQEEILRYYHLLKQYNRLFEHLGQTTRNQVVIYVRQTRIKSNEHSIDVPWTETVKKIILKNKKMSHWHLKEESRHIIPGNSPQFNRVYHILSYKIIPE